MMQVFFLRRSGIRVLSGRFLVWLGIFLSLTTAKNVSAFPTITLQPISISISSNLPAVFTVTATQLGNLSPLSVQWRRNGQDIPGALTVSLVGNVNSTLTINNVQPSDAGSYYAIIYDSDGAIDTAIVDLKVTNLLAVLANDNFALRGSLGSLLSGSRGANNINATNEPGGPNIAGIPGGATVWLKWVAPTNGVVTFDTRGSDFDTTLGIYTNQSLQFQSVTNLGLVAGDDDSGNYFNSSVALNAIAGQEYEIAIDGFYGATGNIVLSWSLEQTSEQVPIILTQPINVIVTSNTSVTLSITVSTNVAAGLPFCLWSLNGNTVDQGVDTSLEIPAVTATNVGQYRVLVSYVNQSSTNIVSLSQPINVQIDAQGNTNAIAWAKFREASDPSFEPNLKIHPLVAPVSGFTGTHIYNTYGAASEPGEPNPCDKAGGAPYWFSYQAPANGNLTVDAYTPTFTNVLAIYTWPGGDFSTLVPVACASTNTGVGHETTTFPVTNGITYYLVVDGLNAATGPVTLSYNLPAPPVITTQPQSQTVWQGSNVTLTVAANGTPPLLCQWQTNSVSFLGQTNTFMTVSNFQAGNQWNCDVVVTNVVGAVTSSIATLYLNSPLRFFGSSLNPTSDFSATLLGAANTNYLFQTSTNLGSGNWITIATNSSPFGIISITDTNAQNYLNRFYRAVPQ